MKKLLLLAIILVAFSANAKLTIEQKWQSTNLPAGVNDNRQGVGHNGKFYIQDKATRSVYLFDENGMTGDSFTTGGNCGIAFDDAGNIIVSCSAFPNAWGAGTEIKVINPETGECKYYELPAGAVQGRCDFLGHAKGNLMEDGELYLVGANQTGVYRLVIAYGEVDEDNSYEALLENGSASSSTIVNAFTDANGDDALLYVYRSGAPRVCTFEGDNLVSTALTLPNKGACNGAQAFALGGKNYVVYPTLPNYQDGFAVAEMGAEEAEFEVMPTGKQTNTFQCNWLNVEVVDDNTAMLYQYQPGGHMSVYEIKVEQPKYSLVGYINGADYGCEADYENPGEYIFENGKLKVTFNEPSYVFVKTTDNSKWFLSPEYVPFNAEYIHGDFYNGANYGEKMQVPAGEVDFRLTVVDADHVYLSATSDFEQTYYMKHPWGGGDWTWLEMTKLEDVYGGMKLAEAGDTYYVDAEYGGAGVNVNTSASDDGAQWFAEPELLTDLAVGDMCRFTYYAGNNTVDIRKVPSTAINDLTVKAEKVYKVIENGQVIIVKGNTRYNVAGQAVK